MATRLTNEAVVLYRKAVLAEYEAEIHNSQLSKIVNTLSREEMHDYMRMTEEIELAVYNFGPHTPRAVYKAALNAAGKDLT